MVSNNYFKETSSKMISDEMGVQADAATDTIASPGTGKLLEVMGYNIVEAWNAAVQVQTPARLWFGTMGSPGHWVWAGLQYQNAAAGVGVSSITGIRIRGDENQCLTLRNMDFAAGAASVNAVIYYRIVSI